MSKHNTHSSDAESGKPYDVGSSQLPLIPPTTVPPLSPTTTDSASKRKQIHPNRGGVLYENSAPRETGPANINTSVEAAIPRAHPLERNRNCSIYCHCNLDLIFCWAALLLSCGTPYWYYRWIRGNPTVEDTLSGRPPTDSGPDTRLYSTTLGQRKIQRLSKFWKSHQIIVGAIIAPLFPLISVSPLPRCSWAYIFSALTLLHAIMTFSVSMFYREHFEVPRYYRGADLKGDFFHKDTLRLWIFLSLPSAWFTGFLICFVSSLLMIAFGMENQENYPNPAHPPLSTGCDMAHIRFIRASVIITLISILSSLIYVRYKVDKLFCSHENNEQRT